MFYVLSIDNPFPAGHSSALGIRAWQLYKLCQAKKGKQNVKLLISTSIKEKMKDENIERYEYPGERNPNFDLSNIVSRQDVLIVPVNAYRYPILDNKSTMIVDLFAPIIAEDYFAMKPNDIRSEERKNIFNLLSNAFGYIVGNKQQETHWHGVMSLYGINPYENRYYGMNIVPLYLPFDGKKRLEYKNNKKLLAMYGSYNSWHDIDATFKLFEKFPDDYKLIFKGIGHPTFKRQKDRSIGEFIINSYTWALPEQKKKKVIIDTNWNDKKLEVNAGICLTKPGECEVSYKVRAMDMISCGIPIIVNAKDNLWNIIGMDTNDGILVSDDAPIGWIENVIQNPFPAFFESERMNYSFERIEKNYMGWLA